jgi:hypothetical protein
MSHPSRSSRVLNRSIQRVAGMRTIADPLDFGNDLSLEHYHRKTEALQALLALHNTKLDEINQLKLDLVAAEKDLSSYAEKMLMSVAARYGKTSLQYEQAGGKRRKPRSPIKTSPAPMPVSAAWAAGVPAASTGLPVAR